MKFVYVTEEHIAKGNRHGKGFDCALALALRDHFQVPAEGEVHVEPGVIEVDGNVYPMAQRVSAWMDRFDRLEEVKPFRFVIRSKPL